jgi:hypothetical protein
VANKAGDLLAAGALLFTILAVLYSVWYAEIDEAIQKEPEVLPALNRSNYGRMKSVLTTRAVPLFVASAVAAAIFLPTAVETVMPVGRRIVHWQRLPEYNAVSTALTAVTLGTAGLAVHAALRAKALWANRRRFDPERLPPQV